MTVKKIRKRTAYVKTPELPLAIKPVVIMGYGKRKDFACRLEINRAGIAVYSGTYGNQKLCNDSWERFVERLRGGKNGS